jgi:tryptophan-rich sensory protein
MKVKSWGKLIGYIALCEGAGILGSIFTVNSIQNWYAFLNKPSFSPPNFLFGPVWTLLYLLMGISLYLVRKNKFAVKLFLAHLFVNAIWSIIFFGMRNIGLALADILIMWFMIIAVMIRFYMVKKQASYLLLPYLMWVTFATVLNYAAWVLN